MIRGMAKGILAAALLTAPLAAKAQGFNMASKGDGPVEVYAEQGIEWSQDGQAFIARGNAKAIRGNVTVEADVLTAHYRDKPAAPQQAAARPGETPAAEAGGEAEIWKLEAQGNVVIHTPTERATGTQGEYNIDTAVMVLVGSPKLVTPTDTVTADVSLEYWEKQQMAVARGNAVAVREDKRIRADVLSAYFVDVPQKGLTLDKAKGWGNVVLTTPKDVVLGDKGDYDAKSGIATLTGDVRLTRGENQLNGGYGVVNMNTGISRLFPSVPGQGGGGRVQGLFVPEKKAGAEDAPPAPAASRAPASTPAGAR